MTSSSPTHLMLLPTLNCPARCSYCFGPHQGSPTMSPATLEATARWARTLCNAIEQGLKEVITREQFQALHAKTVDTTPHCRACPWRYLCGGYCRAWRQGASIDAPPADCSALQKQAQAKLHAALEALGIPPERWETA